MVGQLGGEDLPDLCEAHSSPSPRLRKLLFLSNLLERTSLRRELRDCFSKERGRPVPMAAGEPLIWEL